MRLFVLLTVAAVLVATLPASAAAEDYQLAFKNGSSLEATVYLFRDGGRLQAPTEVPAGKSVTLRWPPTHLAGHNPPTEFVVDLHYRFVVNVLCSKRAMIDVKDSTWEVRGSRADDCMLQRKP